VTVRAHGRLISGWLSGYGCADILTLGRSGMHVFPDFQAASHFWQPENNYEVEAMRQTGDLMLQVCDTSKREQCLSAGRVAFHIVF